MKAGELLRKAYDYLGQTNYSTVTTSGTTTITDSGIVDRFPDGAWDNGAFFVAAVTADAAPEGQFARISTYDGAEGQFVLRDALTTAIPVGSKYAFVSSLYPVTDMFALMTEALRRCGDLPFVTTLAVVSGDYEYDLVAAVRKRRLISVEWIETSGDPPVPVLNYKIRPATAAGQSPTLVFPGGIATGTLQLNYFGEHPEVDSYDDEIHPAIDSNLLIISMALSCLEWQIGRTQGAEDYVKEEYNKAIDKFRERMVTNGPDAPMEDPELFTPGSAGW